MRYLGTCTFAATPASVREARHWLTGVLDCDDSVLLLSEAMTNAVVHADGDKVEVRAYASEHLVRIEIVDGGGPSLPHYVDDPDGEHGRGLPIMRALARNWGYDPLPGGQLQVWFEVPRRA